MKSRVVLTFGLYRIVRTSHWLGYVEKQDGHDRLGNKRWRDWTREMREAEWAGFENELAKRLARPKRRKARA